jgi:hypothetical protein
MAFRALIIGIETYPDVTDGSIANQLPGTLDAARRFRQWLTDKWDAEGVSAADRQIIFCSSARETGGNGAAQVDILKALKQLSDDGQNATKELFFFFSGHGFSYIQPGGRSDMLIASDYTTLALSGSLCINLDETIFWLRQQLGPGRHYYFIDACRNVLDNRVIRPGGLPLPSNPQTSGEASTYVLQSVDQGGVAAVDQKFTGALMSGLGGKSIAKIWDEGNRDTMLVRYDSLRSFMRTALKQKIYSTVEGLDGESDAVFAVLKPAPSSKCTVKVTGGTSAPSGFVTCTGQRGTTKLPLSGAIMEIELKPDRYNVALEITGSPAPGVQQVMLYDDATLIFEQTEAPLIDTAELKNIVEGPLADIVMPADNTIELHDLESGSSRRFRGAVRTRMPIGRYSATLRDKEDRVVRRTEVLIGAQEPSVIDPADWKESAPHRALAGPLPQAGGGVLFSESLQGPVTDPDLDIWLAIVGGGKILGGAAGDFTKIALLPLDDLSTFGAGSSPIYVLAGLEDPQMDLDVSISQGPNVVWSNSIQPPGMAGIKQWTGAAAYGPQLVSLKFSGNVPYTVASFASPNRAMLMTVTLGANGVPRVSQYLLPIGHLQNLLDPFVAQRLSGRNQLSDLLAIARMSRAFRKRRDIWKEVPGQALDEILFSKWLDPIVSSFAAYELIRRGSTRSIPDVIHNLSTYFPDLPDTAALANLFGSGPMAYKGPPLFLDGLRGFLGIEGQLPLPAGNIDYTSTWTAWRGAVS